MDRIKPYLGIIASASVLVVLSILSLMIGPAGFLNLQDPTMSSIVMNLRLPRLLAALLAGSALSISGALVQKVLHNPLASANLIGINASVGFFSVLAGIAFPLSFTAGTLVGFAGGLCTALLVMMLVWRQHASRLTVLLAGMAISQLFSAGIDLLLVLVPDALSGYASFKIGSLASLTLSRDLFASFFIVPALVLVLCLWRKLEMFSLSDLQSEALGFSVRGWSVFFLCLAALLASGVVSLCGMLGFIGLIIPAWLSRFHLDLRIYLWLCMLMGACLLIAADLVGRLILQPWELPAGLVLSLIGGPYFLYLLMERKRKDA